MRVRSLKDDPVTSALSRLPIILKENLERNLCVCNDVPKIEIIRSIVNGATTLDEIKKQTYATMGTGCCAQQIERLIECICTPEKKQRRRRKS